MELAMLSSSSSIGAYELTNEEYKKVCGLIEKGFQDTLKKFLLSLHSPEYGKVLHSNLFCPPSSSSRTSPLVLAAKEGRIGIVQFFLDNFKDLIDINHGSCFEYPDLYLLDLQLVKKMKTKRVTAVNASCVSGVTEIIKILVRVGASMNLCDDFGYSPLGNAARYGRTDTVDFLLSRGASITHKTHDGYTPIHLAAMHGQTDVVKLMLSKMISPLFPNPSKVIVNEVPCPLYLAAARGWQPVVDAFIEHKDCPIACKIDAFLLLGAAARMFWKEVTPENMNGVADLWIQARVIKDPRSNLMVVTPPVAAYGNRGELATQKEIKAVLEKDDFAEQSLYQCLIIHERCMGFINSYDWVFNAGIQVFNKLQYEEAERLWQRAMQMHYEYSKQLVDSDTPRQHDLKSCIQYMTHFSLAIEEMVHNNYEPMWSEYVEYALQQLKLVILLSLQNNCHLLNTNTALKLYQILLQIFSCWVTQVTSPLSLPLTEGKRTYPDTLERVGQSFVDTANVLTRTNPLMVAMYPAVSIVHNLEHFQNMRRLPALLVALLDWGGDMCINDVDSSGDRPLHLAARLTKKIARDTLIPILLFRGAHADALNKYGKTPAEVFKVAHPKDTSPFPAVLKLTCQCINVLLASTLPFSTENFPADLMATLKLHTDVRALSLRW